MSQKLEKADRRRIMLLEAYNYRAQHKDIDHSISAWQDAARHMELTCAQHGNDPFLMDLLAACYNDMERGVAGHDLHGDAGGHD